MAATVLTDDQLDAVGPPQGPPGRRRLLAELTVAFEPARLALRAGPLATAPKGDGRIVVLFPGWKAPESSMWPIGTYLDRLGHDSRPWGLGVNRGDVEAMRDQMMERVARSAESSGRPVNLVGWSLGGVVAREVARQLPEQVNRVVTYGTPAIGGPTHTVGAASYDPAEVDRIRLLQEELDANEPITVPITAIFTRRDGAVAWRACIDRLSPDVTMVEVRSSHVGLGLDPDVWLTVARALGQVR